jgi:cyclopropane fatty-acyl-phospholipid synthase-like methyltransferase
MDSAIFKKRIESIIQMIEIAVSPKFASEVSKNYWTKLFGNLNETVSWEIFQFFYEHIKKVMKPTKNDTILEVGSGGGELTYLFYKDGFDVRGFDSCENAVTKARKRFGSNLFYVDDLLSIKSREKFSKIFLNGVFLCIHPAYYETALKNLYSITEENGAVYLFDNPDYSKRHLFYSQFQTRIPLSNIVTFFIPVYKKHFAGFWVKTPNVTKAALKAGFSKIETVDSWSNHRTHHILYK